MTTKVYISVEFDFRQIMMVTEALDECSTELTRTACNLCCITSLLLLLARLSTGMTMEEMLTLMSALPPVMLDGQEQVSIEPIMWSMI